MKTSIIIAVKTWQKNLEECVRRCLELEGYFEIIILPDEQIDIPVSSEKIKVIPTGPVTPPAKRDIGAKNSSGDILAFLDDDAYPGKKWLSTALDLFAAHSDFSCVCGPAVTPAQDGILQKASGLVYSSFLVSCGQKYRYVPMKERYVVDFPSCNLLIRKNVFDRVNGFNTVFWPGEDTFLCLKVIGAGGKMFYHPDVLVFHHRRPLFGRHLSQIKSYALHRGYFARKFPATSLRWDYFIPSLFVTGLAAGLFLSVIPVLRPVYLSIVGFYALCVAAAGLVLASGEADNPGELFKLLFLIVTGIAASHIFYGFYFVKGLLARKMEEE